MNMLWSLICSEFIVKVHEISLGNLSTAFTCLAGGCWLFIHDIDGVELLLLAALIWSMTVSTKTEWFLFNSHNKLIFVCRACVITFLLIRCKHGVIENKYNQLHFDSDYTVVIERVSCKDIYERFRCIFGPALFARVKIRSKRYRIPFDSFFTFHFSLMFGLGMWQLRERQVEKSCLV